VEDTKKKKPVTGERNPGHCGLEGIWLEPEDSFMEPACIAHDFYYDAMYAGESKIDQNAADSAFLKIGQRHAKTIPQRAISYAFYTIAHIVGWFRWKDKK